MASKKYLYLFCDLDGTLIQTISKKDMPIGIYDMRFRFDTLNAIKQLSPTHLYIVSNQGGIEIGKVKQDHFNAKIKYVECAIQEYCNIKNDNIGYIYCSTNDSENKYRKPNPQMILDIIDKCHIDKDACLMIGDSSGYQGQFSDSDKKAAENCQIDYLDVSDFINKFSK